MTKARECGKKYPHNTKREAEAHKWSLVRGGARPGAMQVYKCPFCQKWHVGHKKRRRR